MNACPNNIAPEQLSAYRSHALAQTEMARLTAHVADCAACQDILRHYERLAQALRAQASPLDGGRLWRTVHQHITNERGTHMPHSRRFWLSAALIASALIVVILASFVVLNHQPGKTSLVATATTVPTSTLTIIPTPTVQTLHPVVGQDWVQPPALADAKSISFSQQNPLTGYACGNNSKGGPNGAPFHLSKTTDGGRTWQALPDTPPTTNLNCQIFVSPTDPFDIVLWETGCWMGCGEGPSFVSRSLNGGTTWSPLTIPSAESGDIGGN